MNSQTIITILTITLPVIGAGIGYLLKTNIEKKKALTNEVTKERREIYQQYVNLMISFFDHTKVKRKNSDNQMISELFNFYKKYVLYASPAVIKAFSDYFQFLYSHKTDENLDTKKNLNFMTSIMLEMRKDLGLKNKGLGKNGEMLMRALLTDYDSLVK